MVLLAHQVKAISRALSYLRQLREAYEGWKRIKYNEDIDAMHNRH